MKHQVFVAPVDGKLGKWLDLSTGKTYIAPIGDQTLGISLAGDNGEQIVTDKDKSYFVNFEPEEDE